MLRGHLRIPQAETRTAISCGGMILIALALLGTLYVLADWLAANQIREVVDLIPRPDLADFFRHH
jgi:hypothetical protein